jgi:hypothetical protein
MQKWISWTRQVKSVQTKLEFSVRALESFCIWPQICLTANTLYVISPRTALSLQPTVRPSCATWYHTLLAMKIFVFPCVGAAETVGCSTNTVLLQSMPWKFSLTVIGQATKKPGVQSHAQQSSWETVYCTPQAVHRNWFLSAVQKLKFMHAVQALQMDCFWQVSSLG